MRLALESARAVPRRTVAQDPDQRPARRAVHRHRGGRRREEPAPPATTIKQTQSAVVLENLISQFLYSKAADAGTPSAPAAQRSEEMKRSIRLPRRCCGGASRRRCCWRSRSSAARPSTRLRGGPGPAPRPVGALNRKVFRFNDDVDNAGAEAGRHGLHRRRAAARAARRQQFLRQPRATSGRPSTASLQRKLAGRREDFMRVSINTVFGLFGMLDVATEIGIDRHSEDFGQTLGRWGVRRRCLPGAAAARAVDGARRGRAAGGPAWRPAGLHRRHRRASRPHGAARRRHRAPTCWAPRACSTTAALDKYTFTRDAYLQRRRSLVFDGNAPETPAPPEPAASAACRQPPPPAAAPPAVGAAGASGPAPDAVLGPRHD